MKIALCAMSGVRACDKELLRLGLTLPGFVERSKTIASLPSLGLLTLAGMTPPEHEVAYYEVPDLAEAPDLADDVDLVAISSFTAQAPEAYKLADRYTQAGIPVVMGGFHVTSLPDEALQYCTSVVRGEGESVWRDLLLDAERGELQPIYNAKKQEFDLAEAPMPAFHLLDMERYNRITIQTCRGCPHRCEFCASSILLTKRYKQKPMDKVLAELDEVLSRWPHPFIEFADDNSFIDHAYWKQLLPEIAKRKIRWFTETDVSVAQDRELLQLMAESGCAQVLIGFESPTPGALAGVELRNNWKFRQFEHYVDAIQTIQSYGITVNGCFVIGFDHHTHEIFDHVFDFVRDSGLYEVQVTLPTAFPGTPFYHRMLKADRLIEPTNWAKCTLFDVNIVPMHMTPDELASGFRDLVVRLYSEEETTRRRTQFHRRRMLMKKAG